MKGKNGKNIQSETIEISDVARIKFARDLFFAASNYQQGSPDAILAGEIQKSLSKHIGVEANQDQLDSMCKHLKENFRFKSPSLCESVRKSIGGIRGVQGEYFQKLGKKLEAGNINIIDAAAIFFVSPIITTGLTVTVLENLLENVLDRLDSIVQKFNFSIKGKTVTFRLPKSQKAAASLLACIEEGGRTIHYKSRGGRYAHKHKESFAEREKVRNKNPSHQNKSRS